MGMSTNLWSKMVNLSPTQKIATSLIAKDVVGCYLYVSQARSNKKFTPKERADVANYDLANGIINVGLQLLAIKPIETVMEKVVDNKLMKHLFYDLDKRLGSSDNKAVIKLLKNKSGLVKGATAIFSTILCQYVIKRGIAPYLSVPTGDMFKELGWVKPKLYPGDEYPAKANNKKEQTDITGSGNDTEIKKLNIVDNTTTFSSTDLLNKYRNNGFKIQA